MSKTITIIVVVAVVVGGAAFYGGMKYGESKSTKGLTQRNFGNFQNLSPEQRQQMFEQFGANARGSGQGQGNRNVTSGEIITKDEKSITVKLPDGGSKIIFFSENTEISKNVNGTSSDLEIGKNVVVSGTANQDGSITANSIQLRPAMPTQPQ